MALDRTPNPRSLLQEYKLDSFDNVRVTAAWLLREWDGDKDRWMIEVAVVPDGGAFTQSIPRTSWRIPDMPWSEAKSLMKLAEERGLIHREAPLFDSQIAAERARIHHEQCSRYEPVDVPTSVARSRKNAKQRSARVMQAKHSDKQLPATAAELPPSRRNPVAFRWEAPPGHCVVPHHPLTIGMAVFATDSEGHWCKGEVIKLLLDSATVHFHWWSHSYDMVHLVGSGRIRYVVEPPEAPVNMVRIQIMRKQKKLKAAPAPKRVRFWDLNYSSSEEEDDPAPSDWVTDSSDVEEDVTVFDRRWAEKTILVAESEAEAVKKSYHTKWYNATQSASPSSTAYTGCMDAPAAAALLLPPKKRKLEDTEDVEVTEMEGFKIRAAVSTAAFR